MLERRVIAGQQSWVTTDTLAAAVLSAQPGNTVRTEVTEQVIRGHTTGKVSVVHDLRGPHIAAQVRALTVQTEPALVIGMAAVRAVVQLRHWAEGKLRALRLQPRSHSGAAPWPTHYELEEDTEDSLYREPAVGRIQTQDRALAAALTVCGFPLVDQASGSWFISGLHKPLRDYATPQQAHQQPAALVQRAEPLNELGTRQLAIQQTEPEHPMCHAIICAWRYLYLRHRIDHGTRIIHIQPNPGSALCAMVSSDATGTVMDRVQRHFRL
jgi:hypothetical protein